MAEMKVTDARGRVILLRELDPADMLDLIETAPQCDAMGAWLRSATIMHSVLQIDSMPIPRPTTKEQVKNIGRQLGNDGYAAVAEKIFGPGPETPVEAVAADEAEAQAIKN